MSTYYYILAIHNSFQHMTLLHHHSRLVHWFCNGSWFLLFRRRWFITISYECKFWAILLQIYLQTLNTLRGLLTFVCITSAKPCCNIRCWLKLPSQILTLFITYGVNFPLCLGAYLTKFWIWQFKFWISLFALASRRFHQVLWCFWIYLTAYNRFQFLRRQISTYCGFYGTFSKKVPRKMEFPYKSSKLGPVGISPEGFLRVFNSC